MATVQQKQQSVEQEQFSKKKIKFSQDITQMQQLHSVPSIKSLDPIGILRRRNFSNPPVVNTQQVSENPSFFRKTKSLNKLPFDVNKLVFAIESAPKRPNFQPQSLNKQYDPKKIEDTKQSVNQDENNGPQLVQPRKKIPIWAFVIFGFIIFICLGWLVSKCFFSKTKNTSQEQINKIKRQYRQPNIFLKSTVNLLKRPQEKINQNLKYQNSLKDIGHTQHFHTQKIKHLKRVL